MGTIGIIGAMEVEVKELKEQMQITRQLTKAGMEFCEGILEGQDVVVVRSVFFHAFTPVFKKSY